MWALRAFLLGTVAVAVLAYAAAAGVAVAAQAGGRELSVSLGPIVLVEVSRDGGSTVTVFGIGIALLALAGGLANLGAAWAVRRRAARGVDRVD